MPDTDGGAVLSDREAYHYWTEQGAQQRYTAAAARYIRLRARRAPARRLACAGVSMQAHYSAWTAAAIRQLCYRGPRPHRIAA